MGTGGCQGHLDIVQIEACDAVPKGSHDHRPNREGPFPPSVKGSGTLTEIGLTRDIMVDYPGHYIAVLNHGKELCFWVILHAMSFVI